MMMMNPLMMMMGLGSGKSSFGGQGGMGFNPAMFFGGNEHKGSQNHHNTTT